MSLTCKTVEAAGWTLRARRTTRARAISEAVRALRAIAQSRVVEEMSSAPGLFLVIGAMWGSQP